MRKILFTGPESTGKTTLSKWLATKMGGLFISEYSRSWLKNREEPYTFPNLLEIAKGQKECEESQIHSAQQLLVFDTSFLVLQIWSQYKFGKCDPWINEQFQLMDFDMIFLCSPDGVKWEYDLLRENPYERDILFKLYENALIRSGKRYKVIKGSLGSRQLQILNIIEDIAREK